MLKSLFGIIADVAKVALAPVEITIDVTRSVTKPIGELASETAKGIKEIVNPEEPR
jgi:hypothetical protein